uniref:MADS-box domain-containing protein n=1 Tax=Kalmanozyma brasiliensis (strain GHG001) TaxID=1365824 RepID=V5EPW4_KALBG
MGRKKIKIQPIKEDRNRSVTYLKRKAGLFKKAHELAVLTDSQVAVIVFGHNGKLAEFCSTDIDLLLLRYTEYDGVAERKGPQNYLNNDKDSDDDDDDNDDNDNAGGEGLSDFGGSGSNNGGGSGSGNGGSGRGSSSKTSGVKRKAEQPSPSNSSTQFDGSNTYAANTSIGAGFGAGVGTVGISPTAKQTINAAIRRKSQPQSASNLAVPGQMAGQSAFDPLSYGQSFASGPSIEHGMMGTGMSNMGMMADSNSSMSGRIATSGPTTSSNRAETIANMSIPMPDQDRLPIFLSPATPGFGLTPNGTVTTPGGRRFSFSDFLTHYGHGTSASPTPPAASFDSNAARMHSNAFGVSPFVGSDLKSSATPFGGSQSSATPELVSHGKSVTPRVGMAASASRSSMSTDEETPPVGPAEHARFDANSSFNPHAAWLNLGQGIEHKADPTTQAQAPLVQPVPINPAQPLSSKPFDLKMPARRGQ